MRIKIDHTKDVDEIAPILRTLRCAVDEKLYMPRLQRALEHGYHVLIARTDGKGVGCLGYRITHDICWGSTFYIDDLVVQSDFRSSGIGAALMNAGKEEAARLNCDHIRLCSGISRVQAHQFYERHDFEKFSLQFVHVLSDGEI